MNITPLVKAVVPPRLRPFAKRVRDGARRRLERAATPAGATDIAVVADAARRGGALFAPASFAPPDRAAWQSLGASERDALFRIADDAVAHRFDLLGSGPVELGHRIDWHVDFKSGARWPLLPIAEVPIVLAPGADVKVPWELSRFQHAPALGAAYLLTGRREYADALVAQVGAWIDENPVGFGANWLCAMEASIRVGNWIAALPFIVGGAASSPFVDRVVASIFEHGRFVRSHLEGTPSLRSNHYLADLHGLIAAGLQFPGAPEAREWVAFAARELEVEIANEVNDDGTDFEASSAYHRLCLELLLAPALLCRRHEVAIAPAYWKRLEGMFAALAAIVDPAGRMPLLGDNDSGRVLALAARDDADVSALLAIGAALFAEPAFKLPGVPFPAEGLLLLGPEGAASYAALPAAGNAARTVALADAGWYVMRRGDGAARETMWISCGGNGQRFHAGAGPKENGGHAHNDKLSIAYSIGSAPVLVDPGQLCYTSDQARRNLSRCTSAHNVLQVDLLEQQTLRSDYLFSIHDERARPAVLRWAPGAAGGAWFEGEHHGYAAGAGVVCRRSVEPAPGGAGFRVVDAIAPAGSPREVEVTLHFHAAPGLSIRQVGPSRFEIGDVAVLEAGSLRTDAEDARVPPEKRSEPFLEREVVARGYGRGDEADVLRLVVRCTAPATLPWTIAPLSRAHAPKPAPIPAPRAGVRAGIGAANAAGVSAAIDRLRRAPRTGGALRPGPVLSTRLDYWNHGATSGGSFGHTAHVVGAMRSIGVPVHVASGFYLPMLDPALVPTTIMPGPDVVRAAAAGAEWEFFAANDAMAGPYEALARRLRPRMIYERPSIGNLAAAATARRLGIPYVLEYNGSEIWLRRHWAKSPYRRERLMTEVEEALLQAADLVVVVSAPLRDECLARGVDAERILVNPNGVDPSIFDPDRCASAGRAIRERLGFAASDVVVGFIGTFGAWHGIPVLAEALPGLVAADPRVRVLLIGDGPLRSLVDAAVAKAGIADRVRCTGAVPQHQAAEHLAACDLFLCPHQTVQDDGRPFFGSPTKLMEYMAMRRPIVASALGQIAETMSPALRASEIGRAEECTDVVGVVVTPGDAAELVAAVTALLRRPELGQRLAENARHRALERHTWEHHVRLIVERAAAITATPP